MPPVFGKERTMDIIFCYVALSFRKALFFVSLTLRSRLSPLVLGNSVTDRVFIKEEA